MTTIIYVAILIMGCLILFCFAILAALLHIVDHVQNYRGHAHKHMRRK